MSKQKYNYLKNLILDLPSDEALIPGDRKLLVDYLNLSMKHFIIIDKYLSLLSTEEISKASKIDIKNPNAKITKDIGQLLRNIDSTVKSQIQ